MSTMDDTTKVKQLVQAKYGEIAEKAASASSCCSQQRTSCCGGGGDGDDDDDDDDMGVSRIMADEYKDMEGYHPETDLGLGCGLPTKFAHIQEGDRVLDLGSGAGNDCFVARCLTGPTGSVVGVDFTPAMLERARANAARRGYTNVTFVQGDIEALPLDTNSFDVIVSNCVLNLVPNKTAVFHEMIRVLSPGGHFSVSDIVLEGDLPPAIRTAAEMYAGCISGALQMKDYLALVPQAGFVNMSVQKKKQIVVPEELLLRHLTKEQVLEFHESKTGIFSITVYAEKPAADAAAV